MKNLIIALVFFGNSRIDLRIYRGTRNFKQVKYQVLCLITESRLFRGSLRCSASWRPSMASARASVVPWSGIRKMDRKGPDCMQGRNTNLMSEDCLFLDIWTNSQKGKKLPVMVWIHGGGWTFGSNSQDIYDGEAFAENGVVLVSVNYRMNSFGWMAHPLCRRKSTMFREITVS